MSFPSRPRTIGLSLLGGARIHLSPRSVALVFDNSQCSPPRPTCLTLYPGSGGIPLVAGGPACFYLEVEETAAEVLELLREDNPVPSPALEQAAHLRAVRERFPALAEYPERDVALMFENLWALNETIARQILAGGSLLVQCMRQRDPASPDGLWIPSDLALALLNVGAT
jgi:hypothetical protein